MDLIRTVSRDISPDSSKDCCDCTVESCQEKENQIDERIARNIDKNSQTDKDDFLVKIESQQTEIDQLRNELEKTVKFIRNQISKFILIHLWVFFSF